MHYRAASWPAQLSYKYYPALKRDYVKIRRLERERKRESGIAKQHDFKLRGICSLSLYYNAAKRALLFPEGPFGPPLILPIQIHFSLVFFLNNFAFRFLQLSISNYIQSCRR